MESALDTYLRQLRGATESLQAGSEAMQKYTSAKKLRELGAQMPEMIKEKGMMGFAGELLPYDPATARQLIKDAGSGNAKAGLSFEKLQAMNPGNVPEDKVRGIADSGLDAEKQTKMLLGLGSANLQQTSEGRRARGEVQMPLKEFTEKFNGFEKETANLDKSFKNVDTALRQKTLPADAVVFNFLARNVAGEKGPLSDNDRAQFVSKAFAGNEQAAENFFTGRSTSKLTNEQRKAFYDLVAATRDNYNGWKTDMAKTFIGNYGLRPELSRGGAPHKALSAKAKQYGLSIALNPETETLEVKQQQRKKMPPPGTGETSFQNLLKTMSPQDAADAQAIAAPYINAGKPLPADLMEEMKRAAGVK